MTKFSTCSRFAIFFAIACRAASASGEGVLTPDPANGNPHSVGPINNFTDYLIPDPAVYRSPAVGCPWLIPAAQAAAQPYNNATNVWDFSYAASFSGTFNMTQYAATNDGSDGGADFNIDYTPGAMDPSGSNVRWMQVIDTNLPSTRGTTYGVVGTGGTGNHIPVGTTAYLDNAGPDAASGNPPVDPYYGWLSVTDTSDITTSAFANSTHFSDAPFLPLVDGRNWEAQTFVTTETDSVSGGTTTHNVTIYGGVWWGFHQVEIHPVATWIGPDHGLWSNPSNWSAGASNGVPNGDGATAIFNAPSTGTVPVAVDIPVTLGTLFLGSGIPSGGYALSGASSNILTFSNAAQEAPAMISGISPGAMSINVPVVLTSALVVNYSGPGPWQLTFGTASSIVEPDPDSVADPSSGHSLTLNASSGTLILSGSGGYTGGTIVNAGTLVVSNHDAIADGTSLALGANVETIFGGTSLPSAVSPAAVPEPSAIALLFAAAVSFAAHAWGRRKQLNFRISFRFGNQYAESPETAESRLAPHFPVGP